MHRKGWMCLGFAVFFSIVALWIFSEGINIYNVRFDDYLYIVLNGHLLAKATTTAEANKYAYLFIGISIPPTIFAYYFYRTFLKFIPDKKIEFTFKITK